MTFKDEDIEEVIQESTRLPSTHRHGYPSSTDDVEEVLMEGRRRRPRQENPDYGSMTEIACFGNLK